MVISGVVYISCTLVSISVISTRDNTIREGGGGVKEMKWREGEVGRR